MRLQDIMHRNVKTVSPQDTVVFANDLMWRQGIHHLVVMENNQVVGVLSDIDLGGPEAREIPDGQQVFEVMTRELVTGLPQMTVDRAANIFRERRISCLPVIAEGALVGIVTTTDIMTLAKRGAARPPFAGINAEAPYPPLNNPRGKSADRAGQDDL